MGDVHWVSRLEGGGFSELAASEPKTQSDWRASKTCSDHSPSLSKYVQAIYNMRWVFKTL